MSIRNRFIIMAVFGAITVLTGACGESAVGPTTQEAPEASSAPVETTTTLPLVTTTETGGDVTTTTEDMPEGVDTVVDIVMDDFSFEPSTIEVLAHETVLFRVTNVGLVEHEFRLSNGHRIEERLASGHEDHDDEGGRHEEDGDLHPSRTGQVG